MLRFVWAIVVLLLLPSCSERMESRNSHEDRLTFCYLPFDVDTYSPITKLNIEEHCQIRSIISSDQQEYKKLLTIINNAEAGYFDEKIVRFSVRTNSGSAFYIDAEGGISSPQGNRRLTAANFVSIKKLVERVARK